MGLIFKSDRITSGIYAITNTINGKSYIGCSKDIRTRIKAHNKKIKSGNTLIYQALREYGRDNFTVVLLEECPKHELFEKEIYWIKKMDTKNPNGYNIVGGGLGCLGKIMPDKERAILIKCNKERVWSNNDRKKRSDVSKKIWEDPTYRKNNSGKNHYHYGGRIKETARGKMIEHYKHNRATSVRRVNMIDKETGEILLCFSSLTNAGVMLNIPVKKGAKRCNISCLSNACRGITQTSYGYKWQYNNEGNEQNGK